MSLLPTLRLSPPTAVWAIAAAPQPAHAVQSDTLWRYTAPAEIRFTALDAAGNFVLATDTLVVALHADSGRQAWSLPVGRRPSVFRSAMGAYFLVGHGTSVAAIDPGTGQLVWQRTDLPELSRTAFGTLRDGAHALLQTRNGFAAMDLRTGATLWDSTALPSGTVVREYFRLDDHNLLLLLARTLLSDVSILGVTLDSGRVLWRHDSLFVAKPEFKRDRGVESISDIQTPIILRDTTLLLYLSKDGPMRLDPRSGAVRWRAAELAGTAVGGWAEGYPPARMIDSLVLIATGKQLVALDSATGQVRWHVARNFRDTPTWVFARPAGILVGGFGEKPFLTALHPGTGARSWPSDLELKTRSAAYIKHDTVYVSNDGVFSATALASGVMRELATIGFEGGEQPARIDTVEGGGFILAARQNLARVSPDGHVVYRRYYKAPGASFWAKLGSTALIVGLNALSYAATPPGGLATIITDNPVLSARYGRATRAVNYYYMFTEAPDSLGQKGFSLVVLDRRDGREMGRMWFDERSPDYRLDHVTGTVYVREGGNEIIARRFRFPA
jgi:outer membrane protein assembly factor BamB